VNLCVGGCAALLVLGVVLCRFRNLVFAAHTSSEGCRFLHRCQGQLHRDSGWSETPCACNLTNEGSRSHVRAQI